VTGPVREVLRAAALLGADFAVTDLATVLGQSVADLLPAVDEACAVGVPAESRHGLGFRHPLIRAALYEERPASVRAAWHGKSGAATVVGRYSAGDSGKEKRLKLPTRRRRDRGRHRPRQSVRLAAISAVTRAQAHAWPAAISSNREQAI